LRRCTINDIRRPRPPRSPLVPYTTLFRSQGLEKGLEQGREQGLEQGLQKGLREGEARMLRRQLQRRFGDLPSWVSARLNEAEPEDRKSTRLNSSHVKNSYAVFCMKKKRYQ